MPSSNIHLMSIKDPRRSNTFHWRLAGRRNFLMRNITGYCAGIHQLIRVDSLLLTKEERDELLDIEVRLKRLIANKKVNWEEVKNQITVTLNQKYGEAL